MNISIITPLAYPPMTGGCEIHAKKLFEEFLESGDCVSIFTSNAEHYNQLSQSGFVSSNLPFRENINGLNITRINLSNRLKKISNFLLKKGLASFYGIDYHLECGPLFSKRIFEEIIKQDPNIIVSMNMMGAHNYYALLLSRCLGIPFVFFPLLHLEEKYPYFLSSKMLLRSADLIVSNTKYEKKVIESFFPKKSGPKVVVGGVGPSIEKEYRKDKKKGRIPIVGYVGRLDRGKGCEELIKSMVSVWLKKPEVELIIAGRETPFTKKIEDDIIKLPWKMAKKVSLYKNISESKKLELLKRIDIFVMVSKLESFGISYLDAWKMGCAVIALKKGPQQEVFGGKDCGFLVDECDVFELPKAIIKLLNSKGLKEEQVNKGLVKIKKKYNWKTISTSLRREFIKLIDKEPYLQRC